MPKITYKCNQPRFFKGDLVSFGKLAFDSELSAAHWRILAYLAYKVDWRNEAYVRQHEIADALGLNRTTVYRAVRKLQSKGLISRRIRADSVHVFEIDRNLLSVGPDNTTVRFSDHQKTVDPEAQNESAVATGSA